METPTSHPNPLSLEPILKATNNPDYSVATLEMSVRLGPWITVYHMLYTIVCIKRDPSIALVMVFN